ncbi:hypothetical protein [Chitinophaga deserti]|uniref:hypothetical protein n=1 Tax=Chitinophaga deserti TaxID=2164099 RepID=UPI000D6A9695|nr:hypothetical protein [Chitinophaga deserti]
MKGLSETWFADGYIDFELKKYTLLAYLQEINHCFHQNKLYPQLGDVIFHYNNLAAFRDTKQFMQQQFPKRLTSVDLQRLQLLYEQIVSDDEMMEELENIIQFALTEMNGTIQGGTEIYEFVEEQLVIAPVGIVPLDSQEGYMLLCDGRASDTRVYQYRLTIFERHDEKYRGIHTQFISTYTRSFANTQLSIKSDLIRYRRELPNPAVYTVETDLTFPVEETLLPIAKRLLVKYITLHAA